MKSIEMKRPWGGLVFDVGGEDTWIRCTVLSNYVYMFYTVFHFSCIAQEGRKEQGQTERIKSFEC